MNSADSYPSCGTSSSPEPSRAVSLSREAFGRAEESERSLIECSNEVWYSIGLAVASTTVEE